MTSPTPDQGSQTSIRRRPRRISKGRKVLFSAFMVFTVYAVVEAVATVLYLRGIIEPSPVWVHEATQRGPTISFGNVRGFRLTRHSSRNLVMTTHGIIESVGTWQGNNQGFPNRNDFFPPRPKWISKRIAVFGDSFTAAQYIRRNWPDAVQDRMRDGGETVQLLNFSVDGGGLANWWSILRRIVEDEEYEIDAIIFAVFASDLTRTFFFADQFTKDGPGEGQMMAAYSSSWDPAVWPKTAEEARPHLQLLTDFTVSSEQFEQAVAGNWQPPVERAFRLYLTDQCWRGIQNIMDSFFDQQSGEDSADERTLVGFVSTDPILMHLIMDMKRYIQDKSLPVIVVHIPSQEELLEGARNEYEFRETKHFAQFLGAEFLDGAKAFEGMNVEDIRRGWLIYDGHWGQSCSDRFAGFIADTLQEWP